MEQAQKKADQLEETASMRASIDGDRANEVTAAYERARQEVQDAIARLRTEISRIDFEQARVQARDWVRGNPELASLVAIGAGLLVGRLVGSVIKPEPRPTFTRRMQRGAGAFAAHAKGLAEELGESILEGAGQASEVVARTARKAGRQARDVRSDLSKRAGVAAAAAARGASEIGDELAERARDYSNSAAKSAKHAAKEMDKRSRGLRKDVRKGASRGADYAESVLDAARTIVAAALIKRVNSWLRSVR